METATFSSHFGVLPPSLGEEIPPSANGTELKGSTKKEKLFVFLHFLSIVVKEMTELYLLIVSQDLHNHRRVRVEDLRRLNWTPRTFNDFLYQEHWGGGDILGFGVLRVRPFLSGGLLGVLGGFFCVLCFWGPRGGGWCLAFVMFFFGGGGLGGGWRGGGFLRGCVWVGGGVWFCGGFGGLGGGCEGVLVFQDAFSCSDSFFFVTLPPWC